MLSQEVRQRLKARLEEVHEWPGLYMFKFIFEPNEERISRINALFSEESEILRKYSTGGKYLSLTVTEVMISSDDVIDRYDKASEVEGVIVL